MTDAGVWTSHTPVIKICLLISPPQFWAARSHVLSLGSPRVWTLLHFHLYPRVGLLLGEIGELVHLFPTLVRYSWAMDVICRTPLLLCSQGHIPFAWRMLGIDIWCFLGCLYMHFGRTGEQPATPLSGLLHRWVNLSPCLPNLSFHTFLLSQLLTLPVLSASWDLAQDLPE